MKKLFLTAIASAFFLSSCSRDNDPEILESGVYKIEISTNGDSQKWNEMLTLLHKGGENNASGVNWTDTETVSENYYSYTYQSLKAENHALKTSANVENLTLTGVYFPEQGAEPLKVNVKVWKDNQLRKNDNYNFNASNNDNYFVITEY